MLGALCRLVDGRTECKMAGGAAGKPIKDVMHLQTQASSPPTARMKFGRAGAPGHRDSGHPAGAADDVAGSSASSNRSSTRVT